MFAIIPSDENKPYMRKCSVANSVYIYRLWSIYRLFLQNWSIYGLCCKIQYRLFKKSLYLVYILTKKHRELEECSVATLVGIVSNSWYTLQSPIKGGFFAINYYLSDNAFSKKNLKQLQILPPLTPILCCR